jgi:hypothetical protein
MSLLPTITTASTVTSVTVSIAEAFTEAVTRNVTSTSTTTWTWTEAVTETSTGDPMSTSIISPGSRYTWNHVEIIHHVELNVSVEVPLTCENIRYYWLLDGSDIAYNAPQFDELSPNADIAGIGVSSDNLMIHGHKVPVLTCEKILLAFLVTACSVMLLALAAYAGEFLPAHFLRRVDKRIFRANSRNQHSRWRNVIESVMMSLSDQQLVTGFAILIAGYYEMMNSNLSIYHWRIVTYLAWLSSSVHIASLTLLRDVLNKNPTFYHCCSLAYGQRDLEKTLISFSWIHQISLPRGSQQSAFGRRLFRRHSATRAHLMQTGFLVWSCCCSPTLGNLASSSPPPGAWSDDG